jgi:hypothetical protein
VRATIFSVDGENAPLTPGRVVGVPPAIYSRPWATLWERYFEQGISRPDTTEDLFDFDR